MMRKFLFFAILLSVLSTFTQYGQAQPTTMWGGLYDAGFPWNEGFEPGAPSGTFRIGPYAKAFQPRIYLERAQIISEPDGQGGSRVKEVKPTYCLIERDANGMPIGIDAFSIDPPRHAVFKLDGHFGGLSDIGDSMIVCLSGAYANQQGVPDKSKRKAPAIDADMDMYDWRAYIPVGMEAQQFALRYGPKPDWMDITVAQMKAKPYQDPSGNTFFSTDARTVYKPGGVKEIVVEPKVYLGYRLILQTGNEGPFLWHQGPHIMDGYAMGVEQAVVEHYVREVSDITLYSNSFLGTRIDMYEDFMDGYEATCAANGWPMRKSFHIAFHRYHREGNVGQYQQSGSAKAATPEEVEAHLLFRGLAELCERRGYKYPVCTETGYNDSPLQASQLQSAPVGNFDNIWQARAGLEIRNHLIAQGCGVYVTTSYCSYDEHEGEPFTWIGKMFGKTGNHPIQKGSQFEIKPSGQIMIDWFETWGDWYPVPWSYKTPAESGLDYHTVRYHLQGDTTTFAWNDAEPFPFVYQSDTTEPPVVPVDTLGQYFRVGDTVRVEKVSRNTYIILKP